MKFFRPQWHWTINYLFLTDCRNVHNDIFFLIPREHHDFPHFRFSLFVLFIFSCSNLAAFCFKYEIIVPTNTMLMFKIHYIKQQIHKAATTPICLKASIRRLSKLGWYENQQLIILQIKKKDAVLLLHAKTLFLISNLSHKILIIRCVHESTNKACTVAIPA